MAFLAPTVTTTTVEAVSTLPIAMKMLAPAVSTRKRVVRGLGLTLSVMTRIASLIRLPNTPSNAGTNN
jgi:hypothetical protein